MEIRGRLKGWKAARLAEVGGPTEGTGLKLPVNNLSFLMFLITQLVTSMFFTNERKLATEDDSQNPPPPTSFPIKSFLLAPRF